MPNSERFEHRKLDALRNAVWLSILSGKAKSPRLKETSDEDLEEGEIIDNCFADDDGSGCMNINENLGNNISIEGIQDCANKFQNQSNTIKIDISSVPIRDAAFSAYSQLKKWGVSPLDLATEGISKAFIGNLLNSKTFNDWLNRTVGDRKNTDFVLGKYIPSSLFLELSDDEAQFDTCTDSLRNLNYHPNETTSNSNSLLRAEKLREKEEEIKRMQKIIDKLSKRKTVDSLQESELKLFEPENFPEPIRHEEKIAKISFLKPQETKRICYVFEAYS